MSRHAGPGEPGRTGEPERGHRGLPHTADIRIEAWGPTREACLEEAVAALVDAFADTSGARPERATETGLAPGTDEDALVAVLDEVIYLADTEEVIPLSAEVTCRTGGLRLRMDVCPLRDAEITGAVPKAVSLHGLRFSRDAGDPVRWSCTATIDV